jgi:mRNA-degrading endonuclease YafQ of YafQ-DinJ toxin-antitoxin module
MNYNELSEFQKEFKSFFKKYRTLDKDFEIFKLAINANPHLTSKNCSSLYTDEKVEIIKTRLQCRSLGSTLRIVYSFQKNNDLIEFIELYAHTDNKRNHNQSRINQYLKDYPNNNILKTP